MATLLVLVLVMVVVAVMAVHTGDGIVARVDEVVFAISRGSSRGGGCGGMVLLLHVAVVAVVAVVLQFVCRPAQAQRWEDLSMHVPVFRAALCKPKGDVDEDCINSDDGDDDEHKGDDEK